MLDDCLADKHIDRRCKEANSNQEKEWTMNKEIIDRVLLASIGAMFLTRERAEEIFDEYLQKWEAEKAVRGTIVEEMIRRSQEAHKELEMILADHVKEMARKLNLAKNDDLLRIERKLDKLLDAQGLSVEESDAGGTSDAQPSDADDANRQEQET
jgi:polyhydroxyalkanoate synthesis regulator phasin